MKGYQKDFAKFLAENNALFFADDLKLKDGRDTPYFVNMGKFNTGKKISQLGEFYARMMIDSKVAYFTDVIFGPSYKGCALAPATAMALHKINPFFDLGFEYDRKEAKTHGDGSGQKKMFVTGAFFNKAWIFLVDDVATTMETKYEALEKISQEAERNGWNLGISGIGFGVDREQVDLNGEDAIGKFKKEKKVLALGIVGIRDVVNYLYQEKYPVLINGQKQELSGVVMKQFEDYMNKYGVKK